MEMYTAKEAARILGVTYHTLLRYIHDGKLKTSVGGDGSDGKRGASYSISKEDLDGFKAANYPTKKFEPRQAIPLIDSQCIMKRVAFNAGYTFKKLADKMNFHYVTVMSVVNGKQRVTREFSGKFADIFGLDQNELELCIKNGEMPFNGAETKVEETPKPKAVPVIVKKEEPKPTPEAVVSTSTEPKAATKYYVVTCYTRTKDGVIFDNRGFQAGHMNLATKKLFVDKLMATSYILSIHGVKFDKNSSLYCSIYVDEKTLVAYKTCYDIVEMEVSNG